MAQTTRLFVAAIDFGTTYSGYAYASITDLQSDTAKIITNVWNSGTFLSHKAPTCLLLKPDKKFDSFGYDAETKYAELAGEDGDYKDWYYFYRFKMTLYHNEALKRDMILEDINGNKLNAQVVFSKCIGYLKDHMYQSMIDKVPDIKPSDIKYVLTVPAIWDDSAKQFMREAAILGGIADDQLVIALEPEAASIFCQKIPFERDEGDDGKVKFTVGKPGSKYLIADLGGGTADITVHEKLENDKIKEIHCASGGAMGGKSVDDAYLKFLEELLGEETMNFFKTSSMEDYIDVLREFETKKRDTGENKDKINISIPVALKAAVKEKKKANMDEVVTTSSFSGSVKVLKSQKLQILKNQFRTFYQETVESIVDQIAEIIGHVTVGKVNTIVMVGGFSECSLIDLELKKNPVTKNHRVIIPEDAGLAVLKGAVLFGYMPQTIFARVARKTYGIQSWPMFREGDHPISKKVILGGVARCKDVFFKYVEIGQEVETGHRMSQVFQALNADEGSLECTVYVSTEPNPKYVTDASCKMLGTLHIPIPPGKGNRREIEETLIFGETELMVAAKDLQKDKTVECKLDLM